MIFVFLVSLVAKSVFVLLSPLSCTESPRLRTKSHLPDALLSAAERDISCFSEDFV
jgi:hypothetical protein